MACADRGDLIALGNHQFCAAHPVVAAIIPGAKHAAKVRENAELMKQPIRGALRDELKRDGLLPDGAPTPAT